MELTDLVSRCRSYRRFDERMPVSEPVPRELVGLARCAPSAANRQPLKFILSCAADWNARIFETLAWAAYLKDWPGPAPGERPTACIVVHVDTTISPAADIDVGIAAQTILPGAVERVLIEGLSADGSIRYYRDSEQVHYVPKRSVEQLLHAVYA